MDRFVAQFQFEIHNPHTKIEILKLGLWIENEHFL